MRNSQKLLPPTEFLGTREMLTLHEKVGINMQKCEERPASIQAFARLWLIGEQEFGCRSLIVIQKPYNVFVDESVQNRHGEDALAVTGYVASFEE